MSENYIVINGKRAELTEEQLKQLGIEPPKANPFERVQINDIYYYIDTKGCVDSSTEDHHEVDHMRFECANYCTDKEIIKQRALHETLNRLLWRYSMEHGGSEIDWSDAWQPKWSIFCYPAENEWLQVDFNRDVWQPGVIYFHTRETAEAAMMNIVIPFMKAHPEFKW